MFVLDFSSSRQAGSRAMQDREPVQINEEYQLETLPFRPLKKAVGMRGGGVGQTLNLPMGAVPDSKPACLPKASAKAVERHSSPLGVGWSLFCHLQMAKWRPTLIPRTRTERIISARRPLVLASALREGATMKHPAQYALPHVQSVTGSYGHSPVCRRGILL